MTRFSMMAARFTDRVSFAANWQQNYFGASHVTRLEQAFAELKQAIAEAEAHIAMARQDPTMKDDWP